MASDKFSPDPSEEATRSMPAVTGGSTPDSGAHRRPTSPYGSAPNLPMPPVDGGAPKKKKSLGRKILKFSLWFLFVVVIVIPALLLIFLSIGPGKATVRNILESKMGQRYDGELHIGSLDYSIFGGTLELGDVTLAQHDGKKVVQLGKLSVDMDFLSLASPPIEIDKVLVEGVKLDLEAYPDGTSNLKRMIKEPMKLDPKAVVLKELDVHDVQVSIKRPDGSTLTVKDLSVLASLDADPAAHKAHVSVKKLALGLAVERPGFSLALPIALGLEVAQESERDVKVKLTPEPTTAVIKRQDQPELKVPIAIGAVGAVIAGGLMDTTIADVAMGPLTVKSLVAKGELPAPGQLGLGPGEHTLAVDGVKIDGKAVNALLGKELLATDIAMGFSVKGPKEKLVVAGNVDTAGGKLGLSGWVDASDVLAPIYELALTGDDIDTTKLMAQPKQAVTTSLAVSLKGKGIVPGAIDAALHLALGPTKAGNRQLDGVTADATLKGQKIHVENAVLKAFGQDARLDFDLDRESRAFEARIRAQSVVGQVLENARKAGALILPLPPIEGNLDLDLTAKGTLKPPGVAQAEVAGVAATPAEKVPFESLKLQGFVKGDGIKVAAFPPSDTGPGASPETRGVDRSVGKLDVAIDLDVKDMLAHGGVKATLADLDTGKMKVEKIDLDTGLDGFVQKFHLVVHDTKQELDADARATSTLDLPNRKVTVVIDSLEVKKGALETKLDAPTTAVIDQSADPAGGLAHVNLQPLKLLLAGGALALSADLALSPNPDKPGASKVDAMTVAVDLDGLQVGKLAALAKKNTKGLGGSLTGSLRVGGTPAEPAVDFGLALKGHIKSGAPFTLKGDGQIRDSKLELRVAVQDKQKSPLIKLDVKAPLSIPKPGEVGKKPGLAPGGRLKVDFVVPETTFARLGKLAPNPLPQAVDPEGTVRAELHLVGTPARPDGGWELELGGGFLRRRGFEKAPAQQKVALKGRLTPESGAVGLVNDLLVYLDAGAAKATIDHHLTGSFKRSPLMKGALDQAWSLNGELAPVDLAPLEAWGLAKSHLAGLVGSTLALRGQGQDVLGELALAATGVKVGENPAADLNATVTIGDNDTRVSEVAKVGGLDALRADLVIGLPGRGLRALAKNRERVMAAPVSGTVELVDHAIGEWRALLPKVPNLPGKVGGKLVVAGNLKTPEARGAFAWDGFDTVSGKPGRVAFELDANATTAGGSLVVGPDHEVVVGGSVERARLMDKPNDDGVRPPLPVAFRGKADAVDLMSLVPAFVIAGKPLQVKGVLDWHMDGRFLVSRDPAKKGLLPESTLTGDMGISQLDIVVPDTDRHIRDGRLHLVASNDGLTIESVHAREADLQKDQRVLDVTGKLALVDWKPAGAKLNIKTTDWLIGGKGFDGPEIELDSDIDVAASGLGDAVKVVDVTLNSMDVDGPDRFVRGHYPQQVSYDDIVYLDESGRPSGQLPGAKPAAPPEPPVTTVVDATGDPRAALPSEPPPAPPAPLALDAHIKIPHPIRVSAAIPIDIQMQGQMDVSVRGKDVQLHGKIDVVKGWLGAMGRFFTFEDGGIVADGGMDTLKAELHFAYQPPDVVLREFALPDGADKKARITVFFTQATGQKTYFSGLPGTYLVDMLTILNTGRTRLWGAPDVPASETVRFGQGEQGLVTTFVQTNLRNLIFMDRYSGWSESMEDPAAYGQLSHYDMQRFVGDGAARWRFSAKPPEPGQNRMELGYEWMLAHGPRTVLGFGPHFGLDLELGLGLTLDWSSQE